MYLLKATTLVDGKEKDYIFYPLELRKMTPGK